MFTDKGKTGQKWFYSVAHNYLIIKDLQRCCGIVVRIRPGKAQAAAVENLRTAAVNQQIRQKA
jgi:hypothetical protein